MASLSNDDLFLPKILNSSIEHSKDTHVESNIYKLDLNNEKDSSINKQISIKEKNIIHKNTNLTNSTIKSSPLRKKDSRSSINLNTNSNNINIVNNSDHQKIIEEYQKIISDLESKLSQNDINYLKEITKLNEEISVKNNNLKTLSKLNENLKLSLKNLTQRLDELIYKFTKDQKKLIRNNKSNSLDKNNDIEKNFEKQLSLKEKELKNQQNIINILSRDNKKLRHNLEIKNTFEMNRSLSDKLYLKEQEIINLNKIIKDYEYKYKKHNECQKEIDSLREKLISNQKELSEKKKEIFISHKNIIQLQSKFIQSESAINIINNNIKERNKKAKLKINIINSCMTPPRNKVVDNKNKYILSPITLKRELSDIKNNKSIDYINNFNYNIIFNIFSKEEIDIIKKLYENNDNKYNEFIKKVNILEKYQNSKDKAYLVTIKKLKDKIDDYIYRLSSAESKIKDKDYKIFILTKQIKDLLGKKKEYIDKNKKLILLVEESNQNYEQEKRAKIELANRLLKFQNEKRKEPENDNAIKIPISCKNINHINLNNDTNKNKNLNFDIDNLNGINKEKIEDINKNNEKDDKNIIVYKDIPIQMPNSQEILPIKKVTISDKNSEKDLELESLFSQNIFESPRKKKCTQFQIISNISHVDIEGVNNEKENSNNTNILFETQPKIINRKSIKSNTIINNAIYGNIKSKSSNNINNNNSPQNILEVKSSSKLIKFNKNDDIGEEIDEEKILQTINNLSEEKTKKIEYRNNIKRKSVINRYNSKSSFAEMINSISKTKSNKNLQINYINNNK